MIVGLDEKTNKPYVSSLDLIGCPMVVDDFVVSGTCSDQMFGICESLYKPNMVIKCFINLLIAGFIFLIVCKSCV